MGKIIEIRSEEDAAKWIGREVHAGWQSSAGLKWRGVSAVCTVYGARATGTVTGWAQSDTYGSILLEGISNVVYCDGDPIVIELLDGAAHPRPEGDGWVWCATVDDARAFQGKRCTLSMAAGDTWATDRAVTCTTQVYVHACGDSGYVSGYPLEMRGGAWIREAPTGVSTKSPERQRAEALEREAVALDDAVTAARSAAEAKHAELRKARKAADAKDVDERWPLPDGWEWQDSRTATSEHYQCWATNGDEIATSNKADGRWGLAPFAVIQVVRARHLAENS